MGLVSLESGDEFLSTMLPSGPPDRERKFICFLGEKILSKAINLIKEGSFKPTRRTLEKGGLILIGKTDELSYWEITI